MPLSPFEQVVVVVSGLVVKPLYMLLTLALILLLLRHAASAGLRLVRLGLIAFLTGEVFCALNFLAFDGSSLPLEVLHGAGMVAMGMLVPWGLVEIFDTRAIGLADPGTPCSFRRLCQHCWKQDSAACGVHRVYQWAAACLALLALLPWTQPLAPREAVHQVFGDPVRFEYVLELQIVDFRLFPVLGATSLAVASVLLWGGPRAMRRAHPWFFAGLGLMGYALFRFFLLESSRRSVIWADFWEETTELAAVVLLWILLWTYRRQLGLAALASPPPSTRSK